MSKPHEDHDRASPPRPHISAGTTTDEQKPRLSFSVVTLRASNTPAMNSGRVWR